MRSEKVGRVALGLAMQAQARYRAVVVAQLTQAESGGRATAALLREAGAGAEVAKQRVVLVLVDTHIQGAGGFGVESAHRRIAIDRVHLLGLDVAQQARAGVLVGIVCSGEQVLTFDFALEKESCPVGVA